MQPFVVVGHSQEQNDDLRECCEECRREIEAGSKIVGIRHHVEQHLDGPARHIRRMALIGYA